MAGEISFSGLSSGMDTGAIVEGLVRAERQPIVMLENKKSDLAVQRSKLEDLSGKISALQSAAQALADHEDLAFFSATSADEDQLTLSATSDAMAGSHEITVNAVATTDRHYSDFFAAGAVGVNDGDTVELTIDGETTAITLEATDTLEDIADRINSSSVAAQATVIGDGAGGGRLVLTSAETGEDQRISLAGNGATALSFTNDRVANDASIEIDGIVTATSSTNDFEDVLPGVTLTVDENATVGETTTVTIAADAEAFTSAINDFATAYNSVMETINNEFVWNGEARDRGNLSGDSTLRSIQSTLRSTVTGLVDGLSGSYNSLSSIGISSNRDGTLAVDTGELTAAMEDDLAGVQALFARDADAGTEGIASLLANAPAGGDHSILGTIIDSNVGSLAIRINGIDDRTENIDLSIERMEVRITAYEETLRNKFLQMELAISSIQNQSGYLAGLSSWGRGS